MKRGNKALRVYLAGILLLAVVLAITGYQPATEVNAKALFKTAGGKDLPNITGSWVGTWFDDRYQLGGFVTCTITTDGDNWVATGRIDLSSIGLGIESGIAGGVAIGNNLAFDFSANKVGKGTGILLDGVGTGGGTVTAPLNYGDFTFEGTATASAIDGTFEFTSPTGGYGQVHLTRGVPATEMSWGSLKAQYDRPGSE